MKHILFFFSTFLIASVAHSQGLEIHGGASLSFMTDYEDSKEIAGAHIDALYNIRVAPNMFIQPGLSYTSKGTQFKYDVREIEANYIELPVLFTYRYPESEDLRIAVSAGNYIAYGINGTTNIDGKTIDSFSYLGSRWDFGGWIKMGVELKCYYVGFGFSWSMRKDPGYFVCDLCTIGYIFPTRKK